MQIQISVRDTLTFWLLKRALKRGYLNICLTMSFTVLNFRNTQAMRAIFFFFKYLKFDPDLKNSEKNYKNYFVF